MTYTEAREEAKKLELEQEINRQKYLKENGDSFQTRRQCLYYKYHAVMRNHWEHHYAFTGSKGKVFLGYFGVLAVPKGFKFDEVSQEDLVATDWKVEAGEVD